MLLDLKMTPAARVRVLRELAIRICYRWLAAGATPEEISNCLAARTVWLDSLRQRPDEHRRAKTAGEQWSRHETDCEEVLRRLVSKRQVIDPKVPQLWHTIVDAELLEAIAEVLRLEADDG